MGRKGRVSIHLTTSSLVLRPYSMQHLEVMNKWANDAELNYYDDDRPSPAEPVSLDTTRAMLRRIVDSNDSGIIRFAIHKSEDDAFIGICMIALIDRYNKRCNIGISIGEKDQWGRGFGREAVRALLEHSFRDLGMNRVGAEIYSHNQRSLRLFAGEGFSEEGRIRQAVWKRGEYVDSVLMGLLREDWLRMGRQSSDGCGNVVKGE